MVDVDYSKYENRPPLTHQKEAIEKLLKNDKFILADDMGLGKTTSTVIASLESGANRVLIICPASLKINWEREIKNYTDKSVYICEGKKFEQADYVIVNYDILKNFHDPKDKLNSIILNSKFDLVVIDEAHYVSNAQAQRTKIIMDVTKNIKKLWLLTGTPMTSRPMNYYNILKLIDYGQPHKIINSGDMKRNHWDNVGDIRYFKQFYLQLHQILYWQWILNDMLVFLQKILVLTFQLFMYLLPMVMIQTIPLDLLEYLLLVDFLCFD